MYSLVHTTHKISHLERSSPLIPGNIFTVGLHTYREIQKYFIVTLAALERTAKQLIRKTVEVFASLIVNVINKIKCFIPFYILLLFFYNKYNKTFSLIDFKD